MLGLACYYVVYYRFVEGDYTPESNEDLWARSFLNWQQDAPLISTFVMGLVSLGDVSFWRTALTILAAIVWNILSMKTLFSFSWVKRIFGMEHICCGSAKTMLYAIENKKDMMDIGILMQMDAPESPYSFKEKLS